MSAASIRIDASVWVPPKSHKFESGCGLCGAGGQRRTFTDALRSRGVTRDAPRFEFLNQVNGQCELALNHCCAWGERQDVTQYCFAQ